MDILSLQLGITDALHENLPGPIGDVVCLTKRELFAAMAMQGLLADSCGNEIESVVPDGHDLAHIASVAVKCADALLAELAKPHEGGAS